MVWHRSPTTGRICALTGHVSFVATRHRRDGLFRRELLMRIGDSDEGLDGRFDFVLNIRVVDLWHADEKGEYDNIGFRYRGHVITGPDGAFRFKSIVPAIYPGRTRHRSAY